LNGELKKLSSEKIFITNKALKEIKRLQEKEKKKGFGFRIQVMPGKCSLYDYKMCFEEKEKENDIVIEKNGIKLFFDELSLELLKGSKIDFNNGFKIINSKNKRNFCCKKEKTKKG
jgi:iron-sulfur cluster insertion protein